VIMTTLVHSICMEATHSHLLRVESKLCKGFANVQLLGNVSDVCRDGKERAKAGLESIGMAMPAKKIILSLTPADIRKDGNHLDLPMAVSLALLVGSVKPVVETNRWVFAAELGLHGQLVPVRGVVAAAVAAVQAGMEGLVVAKDNQQELASVLRCLSRGQKKPLQILCFDHLSEVIAWLSGESSEGSLAIAGRFKNKSDQEPILNFDDMLLSKDMQLAAEVAATGMHSLLLRGVPGSGKTMFAARLPSILPLMQGTLHLEALHIHSARYERLPASLLSGRPPMRQPHHHCSASALVGGSQDPGEMALAHGGVLFLDELPEFRRDALESLREPLESGEVFVSRSKFKLRWPATVMLVAACNNCPCGYAGSKQRLCQCAPGKHQAYLRRLSGPILQRVDLHVATPEPGGHAADFLCQERKEGAKTEAMRQRVLAARKFGAERNRRLGVICNARIPLAAVREASGLSESILGDMVTESLPSWANGRSVLRCMRVARSLADLAQMPSISREDLRIAWNWQADQAAIERGESFMPG